MSDCITYAMFGEIYAELSSVTGNTRCQVFIGDPEAGKLFEVQACSPDGVFLEDHDASQINICFNGSDGRRNSDFAAALRFLADEIEVAMRPGPRPVGEIVGLSFGDLMGEEPEGSR